MKCTCGCQMIEIDSDFYQCPACGEEKVDDIDIMEKLTGKNLRKERKKFKVNRWNEFNKKEVHPRRNNQWRKAKEEN